MFLKERFEVIVNVVTQLTETAGRIKVFLSVLHIQKQSSGGVLKDAGKFTGKHLSQNLFFNKVASWGLQLYYKRDSGTAFFLGILRNFLEHLFYTTPLGDCFLSVESCNARISFGVISAFCDSSGAAFFSCNFTFQI